MHDWKGVTAFDIVRYYWRHEQAGICYIVGNVVGALVDFLRHLHAVEA